MIIVDFSGNRWVFDADLNQWINIGRSLETEVVNHQRNGILTPDMAQLLDDIGEYDPTDFKISPQLGVYYYLIKSADASLFTMSVEGSRLRIELSRNVAANLMNCLACRGNKGIKGVTGEDGEDGLPGPSERSHIPQIDGNMLLISVEDVPAPLDTDVSFRIYNDDTDGYIEIIVSVDTDGWSILLSTETVDEELTEISFIDGKFDAKVVIDHDWGDGWRVKVRQIGPGGRPGDAGETFLTILESSVYGADATQSVVSIRKGQDDGLYYIRKDLGELPTATLRPYGTFNVQDACVITTIISSDSGQATSQDKFVATEPCIGSNKGIWRWLFSAQTGEWTDLILPQWIPDPSCQGWSFDWWHQFEGTNSEVISKLREASSMPQQCCQEDFFMCPNLGDTECTITSNGEWVFPPNNPSSPTTDVWVPPRWLRL